MKDLLFAEQITAVRGGFTLGPVSFGLAPGVCALVGVNGAGKTTLMRSLVGDIAVGSGHVSIAGVNLRRSPRKAYKSLGYLPQAASWPGALTVQQLVSYAAWLKEVPSRGVSKQVESALDMVDLSTFRYRRYGRLSGGEQRRVLLASCLVHQPQVLILDEPTVGLDPVQREQLYAALSRMADGNRAVLLSTHSYEDVVTLANRVLVLREGEVLSDFEFASDMTESDRYERVRRALRETTGQLP